MRGIRDQLLVKEQKAYIVYWKPALLRNWYHDGKVMFSWIFMKFDENPLKHNFGNMTP
jgi:hypothetical protein